jgi:hypothetical protein
LWVNNAHYIQDKLFKKTNIKLYNQSFNDLCHTSWYTSKSKLCPFGNLPLQKKHRKGWLNAISNVNATTHLGRAIV